MNQFFGCRYFLQCLGISIVALVFLQLPGAETNPTYLPFYIGTYTYGESEGIYLYNLDPATGALHYVNKTVDVANPSFLAIEPEGRYLYAVNEIGKYQGEAGGSVTAFRIDTKTGRLTFINRQPTHGGAPCYVSVDHTCHWLLVSNYSGGNIAVFPILEGGWLGTASDVVQHEGKSVNRKRQRESHPHSILFGPDENYIFVPDLGIDKIMVYQLDKKEGTLKPADAMFAKMKPGAGPRHMDFHPTNHFAFIIEELNSTITSMVYDPINGSLNKIQIISTLPGGYEGINHCADIHVHPSGKFLYGSNRGHNSIAIFSIDESTGKLTLIGHELTQGETPRNFAIDPTGQYLLAANQGTNNIVVFRIDPQTGKLTPTGHSANVPTPVCIQFMPRE